MHRHHWHAIAATSLSILSDAFAYEETTMCDSTASGARGGPRSRLIRESAAWGAWATAERASRLRQNFKDGPQQVGDEEADYSLVLAMGKAPSKPKATKVKVPKAPKAPKVPKPPKPPKPLKAAKVPKPQKTPKQPKAAKLSKAALQKAIVSPTTVAKQAAQEAVVAARLAGKSVEEQRAAAHAAAMSAVEAAQYAAKLYTPQLQQYSQMQVRQAQYDNQQRIWVQESKKWLETKKIQQVAEQKTQQLPTSVPGSPGANGAPVVSSVNASATAIQVEQQQHQLQPFSDPVPQAIDAESRRKAYFAEQQKDFLQANTFVHRLGFT